MTAVDEYVLEKWHFGQVVCIGDSVHKIAPHTGQGANCAMEDAAVLASLLTQLMQQTNRKTTPSPVELDHMLTAVTRLRRERMLQVAHAAGTAMRLHALEGFSYALSLATISHTREIYQPIERPEALLTLPCWNSFPFQSDRGQDGNFSSLALRSAIRLRCISC